MKKIKNWFSVLGPTIITILSFLPTNAQNQYINKALQICNNNKLFISLSICIIIFSFQVYELINKDKQIKLWTRHFLRFMAKEQLGGGEYNTRISVFRPQKGWQFIIKYLYFVFVKNFINNFKNKTWNKYIKNTPIRLFSDYLTLYERYSYPKEDKSYTHFRVSGKNEGTNGVVDKCYREGKVIEVNTCNISGIKLPDDYERLKKSRQQNDKNVMKYMKDSFIDENNYISLLNMNTRANNLYAVALTDKEEKMWGVFVIDNVGNTRRDLKMEIEPFIDKYVKIFCFTLSTIK